MNEVLDHPLIVFALSFSLLWLSTRIGATVLRRKRKLQENLRNDFGIVLTTTLTLSGLIIGFTFSMAIGRYELRKNYEEAEANAIGTEYVRLDLLPAPQASALRPLLRQYVDERILFYTAHGAEQIREIDARTAQLQTKLWTTAAGTAATQPTPVVALALAGMNDVLNSQGYTQAAWWNRIPKSAWLLMAVIAVIAHFMIGYGTQSPKADSPLFTVLPFVVAISFLLIADIDSPRAGIIRVQPQNLIAVAESMGAP
jgi:hypothetical protein